MKRLTTLLPAAFAALAATAPAQTWEPVPSGSSSTLYSTFFLNPNLGWIGGEGAWIRKTTNGGSTWTTQTGASLNVTDIHFVNPDTGWAVEGGGGAGGIYKTTNGGATWVYQRGGINVAWGVFFVNANVGWVSCAGGQVLKTTNGGANWSTQVTGTTNDLRRVTFRDADVGWVAGHGVMLRTTNGGANWTAVSTTAAINEVEFFGDTGWAAGDAVLKSTNAGASWTTVPTGTSVVFSAVDFLDASTGYVAGAGGTLRFTTNGGASWTPVSTGTTAHITSLSFHAPGWGWLAATEGVLRKTQSPQPALLAYPSNPAVYTLHAAVPANTPTLIGEAPFTFSVFPALPAGLALDPSTGAITGTPTVAVSASNHVVTAGNLHGSTNVTLNLTVGDQPFGLGYSANPAAYAVNSAIATNTPTLLTGRATRWTVTPALPAGLALDAATGHITGSPLAPAAAADYLVKASNTNGHYAEASVKIAALLKPSNLSYARNPASYPAGVAILPNAPSLSGSGPFTYTVSPPLPAGLALDANQGVLAGTPQSPMVAGAYTVTAANAVGSTTAVLNITVPVPIGAATPKGAAFAFRAGRAARLSFVAPPGATAARVEILDAAGRKVWEGARAVTSSLEGLEWNGPARGGAGVYGLRLTWLEAAREPLASARRTFVYAP